LSCIIRKSSESGDSLSEIIILMGSSGDGEDESMGVAELRKELASVSWMWMGRKNLWCQDWTRPGGEKQINVSSQSAS
jgi:hypothetical protein